MIIFRSVLLVLYVICFLLAIINFWNSENGIRSGWFSAMLAWLVVIVFWVLRFWG